MTQLQQDVIAKLQSLSPEDLEKVLHFLETLAPTSPPLQRRSLRAVICDEPIAEWQICSRIRVKNASPLSRSDMRGRST